MVSVMQLKKKWLKSHQTKVDDIVSVFDYVVVPDELDDLIICVNNGVLTQLQHKFLFLDKKDRDRVKSVLESLKIEQEIVERDIEDD